jgi:SAM-dependent methyltransferase
VTVRPASGGELLDDIHADPTSVALSLANIARANWWFGGRSAVTATLGRLLAGAPSGSRFTLLDVGTGTGDLPRAVLSWGRARGYVFQAIGIERHPVAARLAHRGGLATILATGEQMPLAAGSVDLVLLSQVAHHFEPAPLERLLRECDRVAARGVIVSDLRRSVLAERLYWIGSRLLGFDPVTKADGLVSIRRGFDAAELRHALEGAGVKGSIRRHPLFRLVASWQPAR